MGKISDSTTKADMIAIVANKTDLKKEDVDRVITCFLNAVIAELSKDQRVKLTGFGSFENVHYKGRTLSSPITGSTKELSGRAIPKFKPTKAVKEKVNEKVSALKG